MHATENYFQTNAFDKFPFYPWMAVISLGVIQILMGLLSMSLGIGAICTLASGYYIAYGIWCGFIFTLTGSITIGSAMRKSGCMIITTLTLSIISACCAAVQVSLGIVAADNDSVSKRQDKVLYYNQFSEEYDIYYEKNFPYKYYCSGPNGYFTWSNAWGPVDVLLLLAGFIVLFSTITVSILGCHAACCGKRVPAVQYYPYTTQTGVTGFSNEAYMTESRMSPPLYKLAA